MRTAVVGHVEWVTFARVDHMPASGEIVHADEVFEAPAGGGPVAAVQLLKLAGECTLYTALGDDELGHRALEELAGLGLRVEAAFLPHAQRRAYTHVDRTGERTITVMGSRLGPRGSDPLAWDELAGVDAVYFCAGDDHALRMSRRARTLVVTSRVAEQIARVGLPLDAVVGSARDPSEVYIATEPPPGLLVRTHGPDGGTYVTSTGAEGVFPPGTLRAPIVCSYGAGDSFAAGLTYALAAGLDTGAALALAADCGAACLTARGPYEGQLTRDDL